MEPKPPDDFPSTARPPSAAMVRYVTIDVTDDVAHGVGGVISVVDRIDVLRSSQPRESVDRDQDRGRHAAAGDRSVDPLKHVGFPRARSQQRRHVAGVPVQHVQRRDNGASRACRIAAADTPRPGVPAGSPRGFPASASLTTKSTRTSPRRPRRLARAERSCMPGDSPPGPAFTSPKVGLQHAARHRPARRRRRQRHYDDRHRAAGYDSARDCGTWRPACARRLDCRRGGGLVRRSGLGRALVALSRLGRDVRLPARGLRRKHARPRDGVSVQLAVLAVRAVFAGERVHWFCELRGVSASTRGKQRAGSRCDRDGRRATDDRGCSIGGRQGWPRSASCSPWRHARPSR